MKTEFDVGAIIQCSSFTQRFYPRLPQIVKREIRHKLTQRMTRKNPSKGNLVREAERLVKFGLKRSLFIEDKFSFVDCRYQARSQPLTHDILMRDDAIQQLATNYANHCCALLHEEGHPQIFRRYLDALIHTYDMQALTLAEIHINPPQINFKKQRKKPDELEQDLQIAILKMQTPDWVEKRLHHLRIQYLEYAQIALEKVGKRKHQNAYISRLSFANWKLNQRENAKFIESMAVVNEDTDEAYDLAEVISRTTANPENRRVEMMVRSRGFEELAQDLDYTALFVTWTLPSKYHRVSRKWNGASVKEGHQALMQQWALARALLAKEDLNYFGFRVAEPHKDGTSHSHYFLFCHPSKKNIIGKILQQCATAEDRDELGQDLSPRFEVQEVDPNLGSATAYIAKYVSKNINGKHMPESASEEFAYRARAWASTHRIRQFQQFGGEPVSLWRNLRRATTEQTQIDPELEQLRQAADSSKWALFCKLAHKAKVEYESKQNHFGETHKKVIGFSWLGKLIKTVSDSYRLVRKKDLKRTPQARSAEPWSTENNCNRPPKQIISPLEKALMDVTGWSVKGVKCLLRPLKMGAKVPIDKYTNLSLRNGALRVN